MPFACGLFAAVGLVAATTGTARADEDHKRLTVSVNALYLLVPVYEVSAEFAIHPKWSVSLRGGGGTSDLGGMDHKIREFGAQGAYYVYGTPDRGVQLGLDTRYVSYEYDGMLMGVGDGVAIGPFVGYKRAFGSGFTLGAQLGAQAAVSGKSEDTVFPYLALSAGWSFLPAGGGLGNQAVGSVTAEANSGQLAPPQGDPFDYHKGLMVGVSIGGGSSSIEGCDSCELDAGIAMDASVGWFVHRRVAVMADSTVTTALFSLSSGFGSFGFGLTSLAVQYWPHQDLWLKVGVGVAQLISLNFVNSQEEVGGGGTFAIGYEVHHDREFNMDIQLRATHGSFEPADGSLEGVNSFVGMVGFNWY